MSEEAVRHLLEPGPPAHRLCGGPADLRAHPAARRCLRDALAGAGCGPRGSAHRLHRSGRRRRHRGAAGPADRATAIVYANDSMAVCGIGTAQRGGLRVPEDLSVVGYDNLPLGRWLHPRLTTVDQQVQRVGAAAARLLLARCGEDVPATVLDDARGWSSASPPGPYRRALSMGPHSYRTRPAGAPPPCPAAHRPAQRPTAAPAPPRTRRGQRKTMRRHSAQLTHDSAVLPWLGANFWSRTGGPADVARTTSRRRSARNCAVLRDHGLTMTRSLLLLARLPSRSPTRRRGAVRPLPRLPRRPHRGGMGTVPTFIVGHMSGENWDPAWRGGRDLYEDVWIVGRQAWFVARDDPPLQGPSRPSTGWLITNEMPGYGRIYQVDPPSTDVVTAWAQSMCNAVRAAGGTQPVSLGDGAWGIEVDRPRQRLLAAGHRRVRGLRGPARLPLGHRPGPPALRAAFECELAAVTGQPVVLEEFGLSTRHRLRRRTRACTTGRPCTTPCSAGATGWIAWNNTDYDDLWEQSPYDHHPFEMHFGITDRTGAPKEPLRELAEFAEVLKRRRLRPLPPRRTPTPRWSCPPSWSAATPTAGPPTGR